MILIFTQRKTIGLAYHFVDRSESHLRHNFTKFFRQKVKQVDHIFRFASKQGTEFFILGSYAHGASIQMALPHHDTTRSNQRSRSNTPLFCAKQGSNGQIATGPYLPVCLQHYPTAKFVSHQSLLRFSKSKFP